MKYQTYTAFLMAFMLFGVGCKRSPDPAIALGIKDAAEILQRREARLASSLPWERKRIPGVKKGRELLARAGPDGLNVPEPLYADVRRGGALVLVVCWLESGFTARGFRFTTGNGSVRFDTIPVLSKERIENSGQKNALRELAYVLAVKSLKEAKGRETEFDDRIEIDFPKELLVSDLRVAILFGDSGCTDFIPVVVDDAVLNEIGK